MADEELHETTADDQNDLQSTDDTAAVEESNETVQDAAEETTVDSTSDESADSDDDDDHDIPMDRVEAVLNATADKDSLSPQMQRMMNRQAENTPPRGGNHQGHQVQSTLVRAAVLRTDDHRSDLGGRLLPDFRLPDSEHRRVESGHRIRDHHDRIHHDHVVALKRSFAFPAI